MAYEEGGGGVQNPAPSPGQAQAWRKKQGMKEMPLSVCPSVPRKTAGAQFSFASSGQRGVPEELMKKTRLRDPEQ